MHTLSIYKKSLFATLASMVITSISMGEMPVHKDLPIYKADYLQIKEPPPIFGSKESFTTVKIYKTSKMDGEPYITLGKKGLTLEGKLVCEW